MGSQPKAAGLGGGAKPIRRSPGFSAIELIIVIVIVGILVRATLPSLAATVSDTRSRRGATEVAAFFEYAFAVAARTDKPVTISYTAATGVLKLADRVSGTTIRQMALKTGSEYNFQAVTFSPNSAVTIFPGGISSGAITMTVTGMSGHLTKTITASLAGQVRIQ
ncbi:MAG TPA: prepilin-type N-terminal cleavage/methylation domain-containing protein [Gemmatimonadaceae bacterium]|jgi:prepilin-type N-terminal cleavage/methylation domain-containing protein